MLQHPTVLLFDKNQSLAGGDFSCKLLLTMWFSQPAVESITDVDRHAVSFLISQRVEIRSGWRIPGSFLTCLRTGMICPFWCCSFLLGIYPPVYSEAACGHGKDIWGPVSYLQMYERKQYIQENFGYLCTRWITRVIQTQGHFYMYLYFFPISVFNPKSLAKRYRTIYKSGQYFQPRSSHQNFNTYAIV